MRARKNRRLYGFFTKRLDEAGLDQVPDGRDDRGKRWDLGALLRTAVGAMLAGAQSLADVEELSTRMSTPIKRLFGIQRRVPDTTLRDALCSVDPQTLRGSLHAVVHQAQRRKALDPSELPFGVVSLDGKAFSIPATDDWYAQRQTQSEEGPLVGVVRSVTSTLTSHPARPVIDVFPIPAHTNEMGVFESAFRALCAAYSGLFQLVCYDAGACSAHNAKLVRDHGYHYLFALTAAQPTLLEEAKLWLGARHADEADASSEDSERGQIIIRRLYFGAATAAPEGWDALRSVLRIETEIRDPSGKLISREDRYLISSLPESRLTKEPWLLLVRQRWGVETCHQILDTAFAEDDHPWIEAHPRAALSVAILRRIAYTLLSLFRSVTQRSEERRQVPWKRLMRDVLFALVTTTHPQLAGLRRHNIPALC
jgi:hypothetical protein